MINWSVLDLFSCQGGAARGYELADATVYGVDLEDQPRYPYPFVQADALQFVRENAAWIRSSVALVHASPPCQFYSATAVLNNNQHPDLIGPTREVLRWLGVPYVIENVEGARRNLIEPVTLCGEMFGLRTYRHRLFETGNGFSLTAPRHPPHPRASVKMGRPVGPGDYYQAVGNFSGVGIVREDWGVPWMNRDGIREAVPPAYTEWIGRQFRAV